MKRVVRAFEWGAMSAFEWGAMRVDRAEIS